MTMTIAEAKALIERKVGKTAPLSKDAAYFQNECHIRIRADMVRTLRDMGKLSIERAAKMQEGYIATLKNKYL